LGADRVDILGYAHSGDVTGDNLSVVGYGAAVIYRAAT
jgi:AmmeMemoRadiSam system protein B